MIVKIKGMFEFEDSIVGCKKYCLGYAQDGSSRGDGTN